MTGDDIVDDSSSPASGSGSSNDDHPGPPRLDEVPKADADAIIDLIEQARLPETDEMLEHWSDRLYARMNFQPPSLDLPGFGEPSDECGEFHIAATQFCDRCGAVHEMNHNCVEYDCKLHAPYAVRRRAAGQRSDKGMVGMAPKLDALRKYLNAYRDENQRFHHIVISPPEDFFFDSRQPLDAFKRTVTEICEEMGLQGAAGYHPYAGDNEDGVTDDRGKWRKRLFHRRDWEGDVFEELQDRLHMHLVVVAHQVEGDELTRRIEEETGWLIKRITKNGSNVSLGDDEDMCSALTYMLSHCGIYETESGQRRLAAWYIGPDVHRIKTFDSSKRKMRPLVYEAAKETLGIDPPDLECDHDVPEDVDEPPDVDEEAESGAVAIDTWPWPDGPVGVSNLPRERRTELPRDSHLEGVAGMADAPSELGPGSDVPNDPGSGGGGSAGVDDVQDDASSDDVPDREPCGGRLRHISKAGEYLLSEEWRANAVDENVDELEDTYVDYVEHMTSRDRDPLDDPRPQLPEARDRDRPPDD